MTSKSTVKSFLQELKQNLKIWQILFINRKKNSIQDLADLEITAKSREVIISKLEVIDYSEGPLPETQFNGKELWVFGKEIKGQEIYIKLTISKDTSNVICISFHKAEHSMNFPFKEDNKANEKK